MTRPDGQSGPPDRPIALVGQVCRMPEGHGGPNNDAEVYGHFASSRVCVRLGKTNTWVYGVRRPRKEND